MNIAKREEIIRDIFEKEFLPLIRAKGHDYAVDDDCMASLRDNGFEGIVMRLGDKNARLKGYTQRMNDPKPIHVKDESPEDTLLDSIAYSFFALIFHRGLHET